MARINRLNVRSLAAVAGLAAATLFGSAASAQALANTSFTYQGELKSAGDLANGTYDMTFKLFNTLNVQVGSTQFANGVAVTDGKFTVTLDFGDVFSGQALNLEMAVRQTGGIVYATLSPRQALTATPYAQGFQIPLVQSGTVTGPMVNLTNLSTSNNAPVMRLTSGAPSGNSAGISFQPVLIADTDDGNGIVSYVSANSAYGMYTRHEGTNGVCVVADQAGASGRAGFFRNLDVTNSSNVVDITHLGTGRGLFMTSTNSANTSNALEVSQSGTGRAGFFVNSNSGSTVPTLAATNNGSGESIPGGSQDNGIAIKGTATGAFGIGVMGRGVTAGVFGYSGTTGGAGIYGSTGGGGGSVSTGVRGDGNGAGTSGVAAFNNLGNAVYAQTSSGVAVFGTNGGSNSSGYAGDFNGRVRVQGNLQVTGSLSKGSGTFQIDHPMDPENKFLYHSFVESPDMKNIYDGVVTLDANGTATVTLPEYFNTLNKEYRYQLTCVGGYAPVYIAREVDQNTFEIAGGKAGLKVSWTVTGIRQDPYANAYRVQTEVEKSNDEKGKYLYPEVYGKPESMRIGAPKGALEIPAAPNMN